MIDTVKNKNMNHLSRQIKYRTRYYSGRYKKYNVLLAALFLVACQTAPEQDESSQTTNNVLHDPLQKESVQPPIEQKTSPQNQVSKQVADNTAQKPKTDYTQSRPPMSSATKKRLKAHAQQLISNGSMPQVQYQQMMAPDVPLASADVQPDVKPTPLQLDYEQVEIRQILEDFADSMGMSIIIDPSISGNVTMRTAPDSELTQDDLWPLLQVMLSEAGVVLEKRNGVYYAKKSQQFIPSTIGTASILDTTDASLIMQVTPLKHISIDAALTVLKPITSEMGRIVPVPNLNTLLIVDNPEQLKRVNGLLSLIDADPFKHRGIRLYKIKEAEAKNVAQELNDILKLIEGEKPAYQVMGLERINALLVVAPPGRGFKDVNRWVDILDAGADEALEEQIFIYKCKSLECTSLAGTLNAIFEQEDKSVKKETPEEVDNPNEFKTVSKESLSVVARTQPVKNETTKSVKSDVVASANINVTIVADEDSNALLVRTTAKDYKHLLETIRTLDVIPLEVLINVVIAQVTLSDSQSFGIDWAYFGSSGTLIQTNFGQASNAVGGDPFGLIVNRLTSSWRVTLNALAKESDVNILSRPSLLITNNQEGVINVGKEVPVETSNTTNTNSDEFNVTQQIAYRKTGIELTVTPKINEDGIVSMAIQQSLSAIEGQTEGGDVGLNPTFTNQEINTSVVVKNGETIILGGLIETVEVDGESGVPLLKDVPLMGNLFKSQATQIERRELILIISTRIVNPEGDYDDFNNAFKSRYYAAAEYLDEQLSDDKTKKRKRK
ncbi:MAG: type II secretion system secretin GspD [gamma proteobacterium symbiont of Lucinoma myriamae]|nr:type II secretion system secretin GspD [gamma proteobacterium symbiont of Lucinoma myriamae]MCU7818864.1 type II secretion system secretin GspD [gamma proteobacterium symbiont of Lucinoma myriamae]MCU7831601.1 type II secretion system secretin GspD [gamma proteobacterium symbiont of Lucinoma myriamae]